MLLMLIVESPPRVKLFALVMLISGSDVGAPSWKFETAEALSARPPNVNVPPLRAVRMPPLLTVRAPVEASAPPDPSCRVPPLIVVPPV